MKIAVFLTILILLGGCGRTIYGNWAQEGKTPQDIKYAGAACYDSLLTQTKGFDENQTDEDIRKLMVECMAAKGYRDAPR